MTCRRRPSSEDAARASPGLQEDSKAPVPQVGEGRESSPACLSGGDPPAARAVGRGVPHWERFQLVVGQRGFAGMRRICSGRGTGRPQERCARADGQAPGRSVAAGWQLASGKVPTGSVPTRRLRYTGPCCLCGVLLPMSCPLSCPGPVLRMCQHP